MRRVQKTIGLAADSDAIVLILGETGTGKELVARALHVHSRRKDHPFIAVNCAAIPADLLESELFGHVKGSFTGATSDRAGAFREAGQGTLFLDEIGDMPLAMQAKILRALQEQTSRRSAASRFAPCASDRCDASGSCQARHLRANSARTSIIGSMSCRSRSRLLRERRSDIVPLAEHFLALSRLCGPLAQTAQSGSRNRQTQRHTWPGNVRELRNVIERACVLTRERHHRTRRYRHRRRATSDPKRAVGCGPADRRGATRRRR